MIDAVLPLRELERLVDAIRRLGPLAHARVAQGHVVRVLQLDRYVLQLPRAFERAGVALARLRKLAQLEVAVGCREWGRWKFSDGVQW